MAQGPVVGGLWPRLPGKPPPPGLGWASHWLPTPWKSELGEGSQTSPQAPTGQPLRKYRCQMLCFFHRTRGQREVTGKRLTRPDPQRSHHVWGGGGCLPDGSSEAPWAVPCESLGHASHGQALRAVGPTQPARLARGSPMALAPPAGSPALSESGPRPVLGPTGHIWVPGKLSGPTPPPAHSRRRNTSPSQRWVGHLPWRHHAANLVKQAVMGGRGLTSLCRAQQVPPRHASLLPDCQECPA